MKNSKETTYYNIHGLKIVENSCKIKVAEENLPKCFKVDKCKPDLTIEMVKDIKINIPQTCPPYGYSKEKKYIKWYGFIKPVKLMINNLDGKTTIKFTKWYKKLFGVDRLIQDIIQIKLLQKRLVMVHSACAIKDKEYILITGWDRSGKSETIERFGICVGDDVTITDGVKAYPYPRLANKFLGYKFGFENVPLLNKFSIQREIFQPEEITKPQKISKIISKTKTSDMKSFLYTQSLYHGDFVDSKYVILTYVSLCDFDLMKLEKTRLKIIEKLSKLQKY